MINPKLILAAALAVGTSYQVYGFLGPARTSNLLNSNWDFTLYTDSAGNDVKVQKKVDLPHDWSVEFPFDQGESSGTEGGYVVTGRGKYKKTLNLTPKNIETGKYSLLFDGVFERWTLKVNGDTVGFRPYGYSSVIYDITPYLKVGGNEIEVDVDNTHQNNSRWYSGSGIYRNVHLIRTGKVNVAPWSLFITTPDVREDEATVEFSFDVEGISGKNEVEADVAVKDPSGNYVAVADVPVKDGKVAGKLDIKDPKLWSPDSPALYNMIVTLKVDGEESDRLEETFGIRTISYSAEEGFKLNGKPILLNGACAHHDNGLLGAASFDAAEARKVKLLKEGGFNAVRTSHNPPSSAFLDECDRQGLLVIDEAFDGWRDSKTPYDYHLWIDEWGVKDVGDLVRRDRNHPSVIAWSIGNEVIERKHIGVVTTARKLAGECRRLDPTRPVTEALCAWDSDWEIFDPHAEELDIVGYNYMIHKHAGDHERDSKRVMWQTESYPRDAAPNWHKVKEYPYIIGDFVWTGLDYLGESGIGRYYYKGETEGEHWQNKQWLWHGAYCGDIDVTGWRKPISHYRDMLYNDNEKLYMAVREPDGYYGELKHTMWSVWPTWESWNWNGHEGKPIEVEVLSRYPKVKLYLDDKLIGEQETGEAHDFRTIFNMTYTPGTLKAVGIDEQGKEVEQVILKTAGKPAALRLIPDKVEFTSDGQDLVYVVLEVVDKDGVVVPDAEVPVKFNVAGAASLKASGSADLKSTVSYSSPETDTWKGRAMVIVRAGDKKGGTTVSATAPGLKGASVKLKGK